MESWGSHRYLVSRIASANEGARARGSQGRRLLWGLVKVFVKDPGAAGLCTTFAIGIVFSGASWGSRTNISMFAETIFASAGVLHFNPTGKRLLVVRSPDKNAVILDEFSLESATTPSQRTGFYGLER